MAININIEKKDLWLFAAIIVFLVAVGYVVAYNADWKTNPGDPAVMGHSADEIMVQNGSGATISLTNYTIQINQTFSKVIDKEGNINITKGTWCGLRMTGPGHTGPLFSCDGHDPMVNCPTGYTPARFADMGDFGGFWWTCVKN
jgi:hypothetical protein